MLGEVTCDNCGKTYLKENRLINENRRLGSKNYCSMDCHRQGKTTAITKNCAHCGQEVNRRLAEYAKSQSGHVFCSRSCAVAHNNSVHRSYDNNPNFVTGEGSYRHRALKHYGARCSVCGYDVVEALEVHHRNSNRQDNRMENLDVLCPTHHKEYGVGLRKYSE